MKLLNKINVIYWALVGQSYIKSGNHFFKSFKTHQLKIVLIYSYNKHVLSSYYMPGSVVHKTGLCSQKNLQVKNLRKILPFKYDFL